MHSEEFWELAIATNAALKGLLGSMGQSGHICERTIGISRHLTPEKGVSALLSECADLVASSGQLQKGDVVVLPDKLFAVAQGRLGPRELLLDPDPKKVDAEERNILAKRWSAQLSFQIEPLHLLLADQYTAPDGTLMATLGTFDHNGCAAEMATAIEQLTGVVVDVLISDTDTGLDVREPLIGTLTLGATPLGATSGLNLYEAMRCACAAEFERGHTRQIPIVICRPAERMQERAGCGQGRDYAGPLQRSREGSITYV